MVDNWDLNWESHFASEKRLWFPHLRASGSRLYADEPEKNSGLSALPLLTTCKL